MLTVNTLLKGFLTPRIEGFDIVESLKVMLRGMLSIFIVTGVLILLVVILNKYTGKKKDKEDK